MKTSSELRAQAWGVLSGKWGMAVVATLVYGVISGVLSFIPFVSWIATLLVSLPLAYGFTVMLLNVVRGSDVQLDTMGEGFKDYGRSLVLCFYRLYISSCGCCCSLSLESLRDIRMR